MVVGDVAKVCLPGEWPWAECVAVHGDGTWDGKILNQTVGQMTEAERFALAQDMFPGAADPIASMHEHKCGDIVCFALGIVGGHDVWVPQIAPRAN